MTGYPMAPPRLNFAGYCTFCDEQGCCSPQCVTAYEAFRWAVCGVCGGKGFTDSSTCPECLWGVQPVGKDFTGPTARGREVSP